MLQIGGLALVVVCGGCYSHARAYPRCEPPIAFDLVVSAADVIINAIRIDHANDETEDRHIDQEDEINAATAALAAAPPALDRAMIANSLVAAEPNLARCSRPALRRIRISIAVIPAGTVDRVVVRDPVDLATSDCIVDILQTTLFPITQRGGSFTYPFTI